VLPSSALFTVDILPLVAYDIKLLLVSFDVPTKKIESFSLTSILNMAYYLQVRLGAYPGVDLFKTFLDKIYA